jgi:hypothetical protein
MNRDLIDRSILGKLANEQAKESPTLGWALNL